MPADLAILTRIEAALDTVRPFLQADQGDVRIHQLTETLDLELELLGSCSSCSMSTMTMKAGIESVIRRMVPEVVEITTINPVQISPD
jgi:Fe-S cluster biogenesis protein NfuA